VLGPHSRPSWASLVGRAGRGPFGSGPGGGPAACIRRAVWGAFSGRGVICCPWRSTTSAARVGVSEVVSIGWRESVAKSAVRGALEVFLLAAQSLVLPYSGSWGRLGHWLRVGSCGFRSCGAGFVSRRTRFGLGLVGFLACSVCADLSFFPFSSPLF